MIKIKSPILFQSVPSKLQRGYKLAPFRQFQDHKKLKMWTLVILSALVAMSSACKSVAEVKAKVKEACNSENNGNVGFTNGEGNVGELNGCGNSGDGNGNGNTGDLNGNLNTGNNNGNGNVGNGNGNGNVGNGNGNGNIGTGNGNGNVGNGNGNGNIE